MKEVIKKILLIFLAIIVLEIVAFALKTKHEVKYKVDTDNNIYSIDEVYNKGSYYFKVSMNDSSYTFSYDNNFFKQKHVVKEIYYYEKDDLKCIYPILKNNKYLNILCLNNDEQYTYSYYKNELKDFVSMLHDKGYDNNLFTTEEKFKNIYNATIYQDNIMDDTYIYVWKYNGFYSLNNKKVSKVDILSNDTYQNNLGVKVSKYYVIPDYDQKYEYNKLYIINMINNKIKELTFKKKKTITNDYYINGIIDNKLYIFDVDNLTQYKINPKNNTYKVVGNKADGGIYYDESWINKNIYDFKEKKLIFDTSFDIPKEIEEYDEIFKSNDNYYYKLGNDYIIYNDVTKTKTYLFNLKDVFSTSLIDDTLYFINEDSLYYYNIKTGLKKIITYDELLFNKNNRYAVYKK